MARKKSHIPGVSFSAKRALGVTKMKQKIARSTGIPTTKSGRQRKYGKMMSGGGGCILPILSVFAILLVIMVFICL